MRRLFLVLLLLASTSWGAMDFNTATSRAENTSATGFDVDQISFLFWFYATSWSSFETLFSADETPLSGGGAIWIHLDGANSAVSFRYYRSTERGHWNSQTFALNEWVCVAVSYDRTSTSNDPIFYIRRLGTHSDLQPNTTPDEIRTPSGTVISPSAGYTISDQDFPFARYIAYPQVWNRILSEAEFEAASLNPGSVTSGLILYLDDSGNDLSASNQDATLTNVGTAAGPPGIPAGGATTGCSGVLLLGVGGCR